MKKVLLLDDIHPLIPEALAEMGYQCDHFYGSDRKRAMEILGDYTGLMVRSKFVIDRNFLAGAKKLKFIARVGAGMENIDVAYAESAGIACLNSPEGNRDAVAEHATGMLLALMNNMVRADRQVREGQWLREENRGFELLGRTVGIIGYGNMGSAFARRLSGFGVRTISFDKYKTNYADGFTEEVSMADIFRLSDIVSLHVPLTEETCRMVDGDFLNRFEKSIRLINTSRGKVVKTSALVDALKSGKVSGAALDVLEFEDESFEGLSGADAPDLDYLKSSDRVVMTPHVAGWTHESRVKLATVLVEKIRAMGL